MKKVWITTLAIAATFQLMAQTTLSPETRMFVSKFENASDISDYVITPINGEDHIGALLQIDPNSIDEDILKQHDCIVGTKTATVWSVKVPVNRLQQLSEIEGIQYIKVSKRYRPMLDAARADAYVDDVHTGTSLPTQYKGNGVVVGIIDGGFDFTHPTFKDATGNQLRITKAWMQEGTGTPPAGYGYGKEVAGETALLAEQFDGVTEESHGSHVAGIAGGSGFGLTGLSGVAPESELVFVGRPGDESNILDAITYIFGHAQSSGKPAVINMSFGGMTESAHDGLSLLDVGMGASIGAGNILVASAANAGVSNGHLQHAFNNDTIQAWLDGDEPEESFVRLWGEAGNTVSYQFRVYSNTGTLLYSTAFFNSSSNNGFGETYTNGGDQIDFYVETESANPQNGRPNILGEAIMMVNNPAQYRVYLVATASNGTTMHGWSEMGRFATAQYGTYTNVTGNSQYTIAGAGANSDATISVGAYNTKNSWTSLSSGTITDPWVIGDVSDYSSIGPTLDGRVKPDISAPGTTLVSAVSNFDTNVPAGYDPQVTNTTYTDGVTTWYTAAFEGTSMSAPFTTGVVALMLESDPTMTTAQVRTTLHNTARQDGFTGVIGAGGDNHWGWGKINALAALQQTVGIEELNAANINLYPNPATDQITVQADRTITAIHITDISGRVVATQPVNATQTQVDVSTLASGVFFVRLETDGGTITKKLLIQ
jgi:minor extracellular serine protease Vpr